MPQTKLMPQFELLLRLLQCSEESARNAAIRSSAQILDGNWDAFERLLHRHRVARRAVIALANAGVQVPDALQQQAMRKAVAAMEQIAEIDRLQTSLNTEGIDSLLLKGPVLSEALYGDPTLRDSKDIDLLVDRADFGRAMTVLTEQHGYVCHSCPPATSERFAIWLDGNKDALLASMRGFQLELHHRITAVELLLPTLGFEDAVDQVMIGSKTFAIFDRTNLFVYLCVHGAYSRWHRLGWLADVYAMLSSASEADILAWHRAAQAHGVVRCTLSAMQLCRELWDLTLPEAIIRAGETDPLVAKIVANSLETLTDDSYLPATARGLGFSRNAMILRDGWRYKASLLKELTLDPELIAGIPLPHRLRFFYVPLRFAQWIRRKLAKVVRLTGLA